MGDGKEPAELLAEALRAQAARAQVPPAEHKVAKGHHEFGMLADSSFELLSGSDYESGPGYAAHREPAATIRPATTRIVRVAPGQQRAGAGWILLAALLLGLAAGAVAGLLTVL